MTGGQATNHPSPTSNGRAMKRFCLFPLAIIAALLLTVGVGPANSSVNYWNIYDGPRDARSGLDIRQTFLSVGEPGRINVRLEGYEFVRERINTAAVYFDTRKANAGPEFRVRWLLPDDGDSRSGVRMAQLDTWMQRGRTVSCSGIRRSIDYARDIIRFSVPRACLGRPEKVRWAVDTGRVTEYHSDGSLYGYWDFVPRRFGFVDGFWVG